MSFDVLARAARSRRRWRTTVGVVGAALAMTCAGVLFAHSTHTTTTPQMHGGIIPGPPADEQTGSATPTASSILATPGISPGSTVRATEVGISAPLPKDLTWTPVDGVEVPISATAGPLRQSGGAEVAFVHDRAGAVLAAANILVRITPQVGPQEFGPTLEDQVTGPSAEALTLQVNTAYQQLCSQSGISPGGPVGTITTAFAGYQIQFFGGTAAVVAVLTEATRDATTIYAATTVQLTWSGTDWLLVAPDGGVWTSSMTQIDAADTVGYEPFMAGR